MTDEELEKATQDEIGDQLDRVMDRISELQEKMGRIAKDLQGPSPRYGDDRTKERDLALLTEELAALREYHERLKKAWYRLDRKAKAS